jgi:hypothetical protein
VNAAWRLICPLFPDFALGMPRYASGNREVVSHLCHQSGLFAVGLSSASLCLPLAFASSDDTTIRSLTFCGSRPTCVSEFLFALSVDRTELMRTCGSSLETITSCWDSRFTKEGTSIDLLSCSLRRTLFSDDANAPHVHFTINAIVVS